MNRIFIGCGTALVTPFTNGGKSVDYDAFGALVERQIAAGIDFLVPLGTTGEAVCLDMEEQLKILSLTVELTKGKIPVLVGVGANNTQAVVEKVRLFESKGVDGFLVVTPYYNKPPQSGLLSHFKTVASATKLPIVLYNVPGRTGVNLNAVTCLELAKVQNIIAVKEASGNYQQISQILAGAPDHFTVLSGNDDETLSLIATGAHGVISVASNLAPQEMVSLVKFARQGDFAAARTCHFKLMELFKNCFIESNPLPVKAGLHLMGLIENILRLPLCPASPETTAIMQLTLRNLKLL